MAESYQEIPNKQTGVYISTIKIMCNEKAYKKGNASKYILNIYF